MKRLFRAELPAIAKDLCSDVLHVEAVWARYSRCNFFL
jgi:hypothetical protein